MIDATNAIQIHEEARKLLSCHDGNNGRALRRFLARVSSDGVVVASFTSEGEVLSAPEMRQRRKYLDKLLEEAKRMTGFSDQLNEKLEVKASPKNSTLTLSFPIEISIPDASVNQMRPFVSDILDVAKAMTPFATDKAAALYTVSGEFLRDKRARDAKAQKERHERFMRQFSK